MRLKKTYRFEASHILPKHPGKCSRLHGHSWVLHVFVDGPVDPDTGFVIDYGNISEAVKPLVEALDHRHLGQWVEPGFPEEPLVDCTVSLDGIVLCKSAPDNWKADFYPTSENLLLLFARTLTQVLPQWSCLAIEETCTSEAILERSEWEKIRHG